MRQSSLALSFALVLGTGCMDEPVDTTEPALETGSQCGPIGPPESTYEQLPDGTWVFQSVAVIDEKVNQVWHVIRDLEQVLAIALPGVAENFEWVDGGNWNKVPSTYEFDALGTHLVEEVFFRSNGDKLIQYRLVGTGLGLLTYVGTMDVDGLSCHRSRLTFTREIDFEDDASAPTFADLFHGEAAAIQAYFAD